MVVERLLSILLGSTAGARTMANSRIGEFAVVSPAPFSVVLLRPPGPTRNPFLQGRVDSLTSNPST